MRGVDGAQPNARQDQLEAIERTTREVTEKASRILQEMGAADEHVAGGMRGKNSEPRAATTSMGVAANSYRPGYQPLLPAPLRPVPVPPAPAPPVSQLAPKGGIHLPDRHRFPCTICRRVLPSNAALAEHIRGHNGEFSCPECLADTGQTNHFSRKNTLDIHRENAHGVPYVRKKGLYRGFNKAEIDAAEAMILMQKGK